MVKIENCNLEYSYLECIIKIQLRSITLQIVFHIYPAYGD
jgi:hypothetical protein